MKSTYKIDTREAWLNACAELLAHGRFSPKGYDVPSVRVSVGFPAGVRKSGLGAIHGTTHRMSIRRAY